MDQLTRHPDDDPLLRDLRRVLRSTPGHPGDWVRLDDVHRGASALRRRRQAMVALSGAVALVAAGVVGAAALNRQRETRPPVTSTVSPTPTPTPSPTSSPTPSTSPTPQPSPSPSPTVALPADFRPLAFTATGSSTFWVLGRGGSCAGGCLALARTTDAGRTFTAVAPPDADPGSISDVRFVDRRDGWAFGTALWSTHDGGVRWTQVTLGGDVARLEAGAGTVWALTRTAGQPDTLWRSPTDRDDWTRVSLPADLVKTDLALQGGHLVVHGDTDAADVLLTSDDAVTFVRHAGPCDPALDGRLSAVAQSVWLTCATGTMAGVHVSTDGGASFRRVDLRIGLPNSVQAGARDAGHAVLGEPQTGLLLVDATGRVLATTPFGAGDVTSVGFTTPDVGYAVVDEGTTSRLLRTTDGGLHWSEVTVR